MSAAVIYGFARRVVRRWVGPVIAPVIAIALALAALPLSADSPRLPPEPWTAQFPGQILVIADPTQPQIVIAPPTGAAWAIPLWRDPGGVLPSPDGRRALVRNPGLNLLQAGTPPEGVVLRVIAASGDSVAEIALADLIDPATLTPTASHLVWIDAFRWEGGAWLFETPDGQAWSLGAEDGALYRR